MNWTIVYNNNVHNDLKNLDKSQQILVLKKIKEVAKNPLPYNQGGYGKPLGNKHNNNLTGFLKIKLQNLGLRVVYSLVKEDGIMKIIVISIRDDETVYRIAADRIKD